MASMAQLSQFKVSFFTLSDTWTPYYLRLGYAMPAMLQLQSHFHPDVPYSIPPSSHTLPSRILIPLQPRTNPHHPQPHHAQTAVMVHP